MECFICGVKGDRVALFSAIVREGVVPVCEECSVKEGIPVIKRAGQFGERPQTVYERLSRMTGLDPVKHREKILMEERATATKEKQEVRRPPAKKETSFSYSNLRSVQPQERSDLIRNYHWAVLNARRAIKLTQKELADAIGESEPAIKLVERGVLPDNYLPLIRKLQTHLGISLLIPGQKGMLHEKQNLREIFEEKKEEARAPYWKNLGFLNKNREKRKEELKREKGQEEKQKNGDGMRKLTQEEMDRMIFEEGGE